MLASLWLTSVSLLPPALRLLSLEASDHMSSSSSGQADTYKVAKEGWGIGTLCQLQSEKSSCEDWLLTTEDGRLSETLRLGDADAVFDEALSQVVRDGDISVKQEAPHWPEQLVDKLQRRGMSGKGTICFDGEHFLELLSSSALDSPLLLPNAAKLLGLEGLERAQDLLRSVATSLRCGRVDVSDNSFAEVLQRAMRAEKAALAMDSFRRRKALNDALPMGRCKEDAAGDGGDDDVVSAWSGSGRLVAEWPDGEIDQLGSDVAAGCELAMGGRPRFQRVTFEPGQPLGIGFMPIGGGRGCEVGEVDPGSAAEQLGVCESMVLHQLARPDHLGLREQPFEDIMGLIDMRIDAGEPLVLVFDTASPTKHLYAVELPAVGALAALAASEARADCWNREDADASAAMWDVITASSASTPALWHEEETKAFIGDAGSMTGAHVDIAPQLELAHGLCGAKFVGIATHEETSRLLREYAPAYSDDGGEGEEEGDEEAMENVRLSTSVPTDRPLRAHESALLVDPAICVACVQPGDLLVFSSAALHFASNGAAGVNAALYHGLVTEASLPRLEVAAEAGREGSAGTLSAEDVLQRARGPRSQE
jgi:hypothetical protein